ncbi:MAG: oligopeptide transporter, OPT family [Verrucomicrobia bacterium]|nr:MAG: oligopeptide transporter, OPT family [Verrucomicrobiota bacterium]
MAEASRPFEPFVPADSRLAEFTPRALVVGTLLGMVFGASSLFLTLKVGLTVSASIPVAVISITLFRLWARLGKRFGARDATLLEHNIAQTAGSAGESLAFGVGVTMPAILILGFDLEIARVTLVAVLGGALGILMMIPLRRALIVEQHGQLKYPEGTACAEVLKAGANQESLEAAGRGGAKARHGISAATIFAGFGLGLLYKLGNSALRGWKESPGVEFGAPLKGGSLAMEISPEMLGVGYIIGPRIAGVMAAGGVLSYLVLIPMIKFFGDGLSVPLAPEATRLVRDMGPGAIRGAYILYIGAGAVAAGGLVSLVRSLPTILRGIRHGLADFRRGPAAGSGVTARTDRDLPLKVVGIGLVGLVAAISLAAPLHMNPVGAILIVVLGFLFVTVSSRLVGEIGSSSNPISGMTIATLLLTCLVFLYMGWTGGAYYVTALSVGAIVCIASSNAGATSQDLKTGFLVGGTPRSQQLAILVGATASALVLGPILLGLNNTATVYLPASAVALAPTVKLPNREVTHREKLAGPDARRDGGEYWVYHQPDPQGGAARKFLLDDRGAPVWYVDPGINGTADHRADGAKVKKFDAPKAVLVSYIIKGILGGKLPWGLVILGAMIAVVLELSGIASLAFAVGVYLPVAVSAPIFVGGMLRWWVDKRADQDLRRRGMTAEEIAAEGDKSPGVLMASGYIAGGSIAGIGVAFLEGLMERRAEALTEWATRANPFFAGPHADGLSLIPFVGLCGFLYLVGRGRWLGAAPRV